MKNLEYVTTLNLKEFAEFVFQKSLHWTGYDDFAEWLDAERTDV